MTVPTGEALDHESVCNEIERWVGPRRLYPLSFCIPESLILDAPPTKEQAAGEGISRGRRRYRFGPGEQDAYYRDYQRSYFGLTYKKGGWDCMRHLEIMANGTLPFFPGIEDCPRYTMTHYPKARLADIGRTYAGALTIDGYSLSFDPDLAADAITQYEAYVRALLDHTRTHLTTAAMARYVLDKAGRPDATRVLYVASGNKPDYLCDLLFHGMRTILGPGCVDANKLWWMYQSASPKRVGKLYGNGFTYSRHLDEIDLDRTAIKARLAKREFDLVVFGAVNRCHDLLPEVRRHYDREEVVLVDGEDHCRLVGWSKKINPPKRRPTTARRLPPDQIVKQGICFKRELDHAAVIAYGTD
ncbi:MAG: hypothetical protein ACPGYV_08770 [Phycisphaeraceae bacterium]